MPDELLADPVFLVTADPKHVTELLDLASEPAARLAGAVYRASARVHRDADAVVRRQILAVDAARFGDRALSARRRAVPLLTRPAELRYTRGRARHPRRPAPGPYPLTHAAAVAAPAGAVTWHAALCSSSAACSARSGPSG